MPKPGGKWSFTGGPAVTYTLLILLLSMKMCIAMSSVLWWLWNGKEKKIGSRKTVKDNLYLFSMEGGELFQRIQDRADGAFTERGRKH